MRLVSNLHRLVDRQFLAVALHPLAVDRYEAPARSYGPERGLGLTDIAFPALKLLEAALVDRALGNPTLTGLVLCSKSAARRVVEECVRTCRSGWSPYHTKKKKNSQD